jgi:hypothetical protein|tara:strand:- start:28 stop:231 length:204 start_codon:yes stop_codon:yes gene_type:complete
MMHHFDIEVARAQGINAAIVAEHFRFWILKHKSESKHCHGGRWWCYASVSGLAELFPYMTGKLIHPH